MSVPARLHVMTATGTADAVILRRGPTRHVASLRWNRETDEIATGQWLNGRIYEHRSDLSPDGRHMICFAGTSSTWYTAISRAPHLRAIAFLPQDSTWCGGGAFTADGRVFLNGGGTLPGRPDGLRQAPPDAMPHATDGFHMGGLFAAMMARRGWLSDGAPSYDVTLTRELADGWRIELTFVTGARNRSILSHRYALLSPAGARFDQPGWEWAERWADGLHHAEAGRLCFSRIAADGTLTGQREIADLTPMTFERLVAPYDGVDTR